MQPSDDIARLIEIMAALRTPETGCPWDLTQTFASIAPYTIEEAYEVAEAIQRCDLRDLRDELGDLLLQVVYHARMAEEAGAFRFEDVVLAITRKMIRRHPHVFGSPHERARGAAEGFWEAIKATERAERLAEGRADTPAGVLADVPISMPGLTRAIKLQDKAARVGFDWPTIAPVFDKVREEISELEEVALPAVEHGAVRDEATTHRIEEEFGDLMFVMANVARHLKVDPEAALRGANQKFMRRFAFIEAALAKDGRTPDQSTLAEMDALWDAAKAAEKASL